MKITSKHEQSIRLLCEGKSQAETARLVGVSPRTLFRWLGDPDYAYLLANGRATLRSEITTKLHTKANAAVDVIVGLMDNPNIPAIVRLKAATDVLQRTIGDATTQDLAMKVEALEKLLHEANVYS